MYCFPLLRRLACLALFAAAQAAAGAESVPLYVGYADPPFSTTRPDSLTVELAAALTARARGRYQFKPVQLPRKRLNMVLAEPGWKGVVAWANPAWFNDEAMRRHAWSLPYMTDANLVVSLRSRPVEYTDQGNSLAGLRLGCIAGQRYPDLERLFKAGQVERNDVASELQNLQKLRLGRIDAALVQASSMPYFRQALPDLDLWLHVAHNPRNSFKRFLFTNRRHAAMVAFLNGALGELARDPLWQARLGAGAPPARD